jgi:hypothetical protein
MPFEETPENAQTGTFEDSTVDENRTEEIWLEDAEGKAYGFLILPKEEVPWRKKSEEVENAVGQTGFSAVEYYKNMLSYQIKETSFGAEDRLETWLTAASNDLLETLEDHVPEPHGDSGADVKANAALQLVGEFVETEADENATVADLRRWLQTRAEGDEGK